MNTLKINNFTFQLPSRINDINAYQLKTFAATLLAPGGIDRVRAQLLLFFALLRTSGNRLNLLKFQCWYVWNYALAPLIDLLTLGLFTWRVQRFSETDLDDFQSLYASFFFDDTTPFMLQKMPKLRVGLRQFFGPSDACGDLTFRQFRECEVLMEEFTREKFIDEPEKWRDKLVSLVAWLYVPSLGSLEHKLSDKLVSKRIKLFQKLPDATLFAVYLFYAGSRKYIVRHFREVFSIPSSEDENQFANKKTEPVVNQLYDMLHIRSGNVTNDVATDLSQLYDFLGHFQTEARQAAALEKRMEEQKQNQR